MYVKREGKGEARYSVIFSAARAFVGTHTAREKESRNRVRERERDSSTTGFMSFGP